MSAQRCPHDGAYCHHKCAETCYRQQGGMSLTTPHPGYPVGCTLHDLRLALIQARVVTLGLLVHTLPSRWGWVAWDDRTYDGRGSAYGNGATEQDAIVNLLEAVEARQ